MPWRYGIPLILTVSLLHWSISQSLFVVAAVAYNGDGSVQTPTYTSAYSLEAIIVGQYTYFLTIPTLLTKACTIVGTIANYIVAIAVGFTLICALLILGLRRYPGTIPLASACSAAISAACHPPPGDNETYMFPVQWGVVSYKNGIGHCALSTDRWIEAPKVGRLYA